MVEDVKMKRPKLVDDIVDGKITTGAQLRMRLDLAGMKPDEDFLWWMMYVSFQVHLSTPVNILVDCIRRGYFVDLFRSWKVFNWLLRMFPEYPMERPMTVLNALCKRVPGIVIGHYIKHSASLVNPKSHNILSIFENKALKLAKKLCEKSPDFKKEYYPKIIETYERNRTMELAMG